MKEQSWLRRMRKAAHERLAGLAGARAQEWEYALGLFRFRLAHLAAVRAVRERGFWYVDIPRTSSTSIRVELGREFGHPFGKEDVLEQEFRGRQVFKDHTPARDMRAILGRKAWDRLFTFTLVRNPWDRQVSIYHFKKARGLCPPDLTFRDHVLRLRETLSRRTYPLRHHVRYASAADYVTDRDGRVIVSFIGRFERRAEDLREIARRIGSKRLGELCLQRVPRPEAHYSTYYDDETRAIVGDLFRRDVEMFGYRFEEGSGGGPSA